MSHTFQYYLSKKYTTVIQHDQTTNGDSCFLAFHPELEGCMAQGETIQEAKENLEEARQMFLKYLFENNQTIPNPYETIDAVLWNTFPTVSQDLTMSDSQLPGSSLIQELSSQ